MPRSIILALSLLAFTAPSYSIDNNLLDLEDEYQVNREFSASRLKDNSQGGCETCREGEEKQRIDYLRKALSSNSTHYQKMVLEQLFQDEPFAKRCWPKIRHRQLELFFTVNKQGLTEDLALFPREAFAFCLMKKIRNLSLPPPKSEHHLWLVVAEIK